MRFFFLKGRQLEDVGVKLDTYTKYFPQITMAIVFSQLDDQGPTKGFYAIHHPFKKDI
jgi:hypothetical protein